MFNKQRMNKKEYRALLKHPKWKTKRMQIIKRDGYACKVCGKKKYLQVHHKYYEGDKSPWQYPNKALITLCSVCHKKEHKRKDISSFFRKKNKK